MRTAVNGVAHLASLLAPAVRVGSLPMQTVDDIDTVIEALQAQIKGGRPGPLSADLQQDALHRFWTTQRLDTLKDARLVAFGLCVPISPEGRCVLDDPARFSAVLQGVDQWLHNPRWYRRGYQGLMWSYFGCDVDAEGVSTRRRDHWLRLREYLAERAPRTVDHSANPDWVRTVVCHRHLFGDSPCDRHAAQMLRGDRAAVDVMCEQLGIQGSSWFPRQLVQAQVRAATRLVHDEFRALLPRLIALLRGAHALRDEGLACLLNRYQQIPHAGLHHGLRDAAAEGWGSPWLPQNELRWNGMKDNVRSLVSDWLKADLIDRFFVATDLSPEPRRAAFWKRYVKSIRGIEFAFGGDAMQAPPWRARLGPDRVIGHNARLRDGLPTEAALVMTMGRAVVVEFSDPSLPVHVYDLHDAQPFDLSRPVALAQDAENSLRHHRRSLSLPHQDGLHGWRQWEQMFEAAISDQFDIRPGNVPTAEASSCVDLSDSMASAQAHQVEPDCRVDALPWPTASAGEDLHWLTAEAASVPYSRADLEVLARVHALRIEDATTRTGRLWVRTDETDHRIAQVLRGWGFVYAIGEGWHR